MKPFSVPVGLCALGLALSSAGPVEAAWNNVFQVTCFRRGCRQRAAFVQVPVVAQLPAAVAAPCPPPCPPPQPVCTTQYVQRCYYQPVTTYQTRTYYEPVTTYQTRYFYEPVTSYRYTCRFDPCTCTYQQVACPVTSFQLRAQSCPVQSWVQRCCSVPVTAYQRCCRWEPQTCCVDPCANGCAAPGAAPAVVAPPVGVVTPPVGTEPPQAQPPMVDENLQKSGNGAPPFNKYYGPSNGLPGSRQPLPNGNTPFKPVAPGRVPAARPERIAAADARLEGQVVTATNSPRPGAQVLFVSANRQAPNQAVTTGSTGRFRVNLPTGGWLVYVTGQDGRHTFHSRIEVDGGQPVGTLTVRSR
jgi:hypothetical protein